MELNGIIFPDEVDGIVTKNSVDKDYENGFSKAISKYVLQDDIVLELGTGLGFTSALAAKKAKHVVTLDPNPLSVNYIKKLYEINHIENISFINKAVSAFPTEEQITFWVHSEGPNCKSFGTASSLIQGRKSYDKHILVDAICIDNLLEKYKPTVMIVDVERYEYELCKNPGWTKGVQVVMVEMHEIKGLNKEVTHINQAKLKFNLKSNGFRLSNSRSKLIGTKR